MTTNPFKELDFRQEGLTPFENVLAICHGGASMDTLKAMKATPNFTWRELFVHRGKGDVKRVTLEHLVNLQELAWKLEGVRCLFAMGVVITSAWRDPITNKRIGGAKFSQHLYGRAADINIIGVAPSTVQARLEKLWEGGMGYGRNFTHLDTRPPREDGTYLRFGY